MMQLHFNKHAYMCIFCKIFYVIYTYFIVGLSFKDKHSIDIFGLFLFCKVNGTTAFTLSINIQNHELFHEHFDIFNVCTHILN